MDIELWVTVLQFCLHYVSNSIIRVYKYLAEPVTKACMYLLFMSLVPV
jgi:hypothetical protein